MKAAVREVKDNLGQHQFVFRTDVKGYYASINHHFLMEIVGRYVKDEYVLALLWGYLRRYVSDGGKFIDVTQGISLGCPLSPLMGALFLKPLDDRMAELGCFYVRFMDDWVVLAPTRWWLWVISGVDGVLSACDRFVSGLVGALRYKSGDAEGTA
jgi:hypothetical protein